MLPLSGKEEIHAPHWRMSSAEGVTGGRRFTQTWDQCRPTKQESPMCMCCCAARSCLSLFPPGSNLPERTPGNVCLSWDHLKPGFRGSFRVQGRRKDFMMAVPLFSYFPAICSQGPKKQHLIVALLCFKCSFPKACSHSLP